MHADAICTPQRNPDHHGHTNTNANAHAHANANGHHHGDADCQRGYADTGDDTNANSYCTAGHANDAAGHANDAAGHANDAAEHANDAAEHANDTARNADGDAHANAQPRDSDAGWRYADSVAGTGGRLHTRVLEDASGAVGRRWQR
jgi:hypothetical protein